MPTAIDPRLFHGLSAYQDVVIGGQTVRRGARDCQARWEAIAPHLPPQGSFLDVGSNFGWFGLRLCEAPRRVVASVEADERSATVQRAVLASHALDRICLLTAPAGARMACKFAAAGQRFDAVLLLSVLHWMRDHREFLTLLGPIAGRIFVEQPDPTEAGAGVARLRREIGPIGPYLGGLFPDRPVSCLAAWPSHRQCSQLRQLWMVGEPPGDNRSPSPGLEVATMFELGLSWPPRKWWEKNLSGRDDSAPSGVQFTPDGLRAAAGGGNGPSWETLQRRVGRVPQDRLWTWRHMLYRRGRRLAGQIWRSLGGGT